MLNNTMSKIDDCKYQNPSLRIMKQSHQMQYHKDFEIASCLAMLLFWCYFLYQSLPAFSFQKVVYGARIYLSVLCISCWIMCVMLCAFFFYKLVFLFFLLVIITNKLLIKIIHLFSHFYTVKSRYVFMTL